MSRMKTQLSRYHSRVLVVPDRMLPFLHVVRLESFVVVSYDESNDEVAVGGQSYSNNEYLIVDGKKMTVYTS